ncbi:TasA family protein [Clavibacter michiganensis]|uniref:Camelysin metallo-endopeptidase n=1 Tax=Clavibacter michiganensis subsp. insidiosus TaxID=33014 RepID=A0A0D5CEV8_9MICO|nr:TasA family protein [Clavibacter michiganensis]AJW77824.1 hypothetical protein VO01_00435 [Clavibacter michiganensis subsp. insidiosus]AWF96961.1 hypothetical protein BEH61_00415 [Clavibacter michiganensis subsp. insidiosus]AWG00027.1 hypothetical protein BEH62_00260 [Clavibacter michiganensis subsp. insidiosus]OQJ58606.1 hypothetical protein B5P21_00850 [Clavibacter michiganensis subsp. insidiosus]RII85349.1 hypothetical protein DZF92_14505 [Clavibacter michiganensis subsp. insidiosus]
MSTTQAPQRRRPWKKIVATGAVVAVGTIITGGAFAIFTDSDTATLQADAGQLDIVATGDYTVADIAPGDTVQRPILLELPDATNDGDLVAAVQLSYAVTAETAGTDDPALAGGGESLVSGAAGLTYSLQTCVGGEWTSATAPVGAYTCSGTVQQTGAGTLDSITGAGRSTTLTPADFGVTPTADGTFPSDTADVALNTLMVLQLPDTADNDYENAAASLTFTAAAIQRDGLQR